MFVLTLIDSPMTESVIQKLRRLHGAGIITLAHCLRAERFVERHPEVFCDGMKLSVSEAADVAVGYTMFAI